MKSVTTDEKGFTLIELMIAATVFSVILVIVSAGIIQVSKSFYKGVTMTKTQEVSRTILDDVSRAIQYNSGLVSKPIMANDTVQGFCVGDRRYSYVLFTKHTDDNQVLMVDQISGCNSLSQAQGISGSSATGKELMGVNMRLLKLDVTDAGNGLWSITVRVAHGENDMLVSETDPNTTCQMGLAGSQFCAISELTTTVRKRL